jgi:nucleoside-diphosphate-sugar epimerase
MQTIVILGAAGRVGDAAARAFVEAGWKVKGLARNAKAAQLAPGVQAVQADATDRAALIAACADADVVLHALNPKYTEWEEKVIPLGENAIAAAEAAGATLMLPGNVYNFGHAIGMDTVEDAPQIASTPKARIRIELEDMMRERAAQTGLQSIVLRAGDFYGGTKPESWLDLIILAKLRRNVFTWGGPMELPHSFAYLPDLGRAFVALAEKRDVLGRFERFHFAGHTMTGHDMKAAAEAATGRTLATRGMPWMLLRAAGLFSPMMHELTVMSYLWRTPHSLDGSRLIRTVGQLRSTEPVAALRQAIADLALDEVYAVAA